MSDPGWWGVVIVLTLVLAWTIYLRERSKR